MIDLREKRRREKGDAGESESGVLEQKEGDAGESGVIEQKRDDEVSLDRTRSQKRFEKLFIPVGEEGWVKINKREVESIKTLKGLKELLNKRYPQLAQRRVKSVILNQYNKKNSNELRDLLLQNRGLEAMVAYGRQLSSPRKDTRVIDSGADEVKGEEGVAVIGQGIKRKRGRPRKKQEGGSLFSTYAKLNMMRDKYLYDKIIKEQQQKRRFF